MERTVKSWGIKTEIFRNDTCEMSLLQLDADERCSWHDHRAKFNLFHVVSGAVRVVVQELGKTRSLDVKEGSQFTTLPGQLHEFQTPFGPAVIIEVMYVKYDHSDINRRNQGGALTLGGTEQRLCGKCGEYTVEWVERGLSKAILCKECANG